MEEESDRWDMSYVPRDAPRGVADLLSHPVAGESDEEAEPVASTRQAQQGERRSQQDEPRLSSQVTRGQGEAAAEEEEEALGPYTVEDRLVWLEEQLERRTNALLTGQESLQTNHDSQNEAIRQIHERQAEDHELLMALGRQMQDVHQLLEGLAQQMETPVHVPGPTLPVTQPEQVQALSQAVASASGPHVSEMISQRRIGATGMSATRGSAPGQATGQAASTTAQAPAQATSRQAPAPLQSLGVSYAQAAGSSAPHPRAAGPPDLMDLDQEPLPASAMPSMAPEVQAPPTPAEILAAANILQAAAASRASGIPEVGPALRAITSRVLSTTHVGAVPPMTSNVPASRVTLAGPLVPAFSFRAGATHPSPIQATSPQAQAPTLKNYKVPMPDKFTGTDAQQDIESWIMQVGRYIRLQNVPVQVQVDIAAACLTGSAAKAWHAAEQMLRKANKDVTSLDLFFATMRADYGQLFTEQKVRQQIRSFKQQKSVDQYARNFKSKVWQLKDTPMAEADQVESFLAGLKEPIRKGCAWNPQTGAPFQDLQSLISYAVNLDVSNKRSLDLPDDYGAAPVEHTSTSTGQAYGSQAKKRKRDQQGKTSTYKQGGVPNQGATKPYPSWQPWHTPNYPSGSREQLYASENDLCFHCAQKTNVPDKPPIPGAHARGLQFCPVKKLKEKGPPRQDKHLQAGWCA